MTNEEIKALINIHINELEKNIEPTDTQKRRVIQALNEVAVILEEANHIPRVD